MYECDDNRKSIVPIRVRLAASIFGRNRWTVWRWIRDGMVPAQRGKSPTSPILVRPCDIRDYLRRRKT